MCWAGSVEGNEGDFAVLDDEAIRLVGWDLQELLPDLGSVPRQVNGEEGTDRSVGEVNGLTLGDPVGRLDVFDCRRAALTDPVARRELFGRILPDPDVVGLETLDHQETVGVRPDGQLRDENRWRPVSETDCAEK